MSAIALAAQHLGLTGPIMMGAIGVVILLIAYKIQYAEILTGILGLFMILIAAVWQYIRTGP